MTPKYGKKIIRYWKELRLETSKYLNALYRDNGNLSREETFFNYYLHMFNLSVHRTSF